MTDQPVVPADIAAMSDEELAKHPPKPRAEMHPDSVLHEDQTPEDLGAVQK